MRSKIKTYAVSIAVALAVGGLSALLTGDSMENILDKLLEMGLGQGVSKSCDEMIKADDIYNKDYKDLEELEARYEELEIPIEVRRVINDYIACKDTVSMRVEDFPI